MKRHPLRIVLLVAIIVLTLFNLTPCLQPFDTPFYRLAGDNLWHGDIDCLRTPVYPLLLKICFLPWGEKGMHILVTLLQSAMFLISAWAFYDLLRRLVKRESIVFWCALYYAAIPAAGWANEMLTESLSISLMVILTREIVCLLQKPDWKRAMGIGLLLTLMVFLRPNFIAFFAILPLAWGWQWTKTRERQYALALALMVIPIGSYGAYCKAYQAKYGIFASSISTCCCDIYNLQWGGGWDPGCVSNPKGKALCEGLENHPDKSYAPIYEVIEHTHRADLLKEACKEMERTHRKEYVTQKMKMLSSSMGDGIMPAVNTHTALSSVLFFTSKLIAMPVSLVYLISIIGCFIFVGFIFRKKHVPIIATLLLLILVTQVVGITYVASDSLERLFTLLVPILLLLIGMGSDKIISYIRK